MPKTFGFGQAPLPPSSFLPKIPKLLVHKKSPKLLDRLGPSPISKIPKLKLQFLNGFPDSSDIDSDSTNIDCSYSDINDDNSSDTSFRLSGRGGERPASLYNSSGRTLLLLFFVPALTPSL